MSEYRVIEKFISINGEGLFAGQPAAFIRFAGCNLRCDYCDTKYAQAGDSYNEVLDKEQISSYIAESGVHCVTLTGGEPLLRGGMAELCECICDNNAVRIEIETNGSTDISAIAALRTERKQNISFTMDYKLPSSGMESFMRKENFQLLSEGDTVKFVVSSQEDLERAKKVIFQYDLYKRCHTVFSPVFGRIEPNEIVEFVINNRLMSSRVQLQIHKIIWDPEKRGV